MLFSKALRTRTFPKSNLSMKSYLTRVRFHTILSSCQVRNHTYGGYAMSEKANELLKELNKIDKEYDEIYHAAALRMGISDSAFSIFYILYDLGDGCLQKDICYEAFANKQTVNSSIRKLEREGYLYLKQGRGRDKHIFLTEAGRAFIDQYIVPVVHKENAAFTTLQPEEQSELIRLYKIYMDNLRTKLGEL